MRSLDNEYIAGLWKQDMIWDLLWYSKWSQRFSTSSCSSYAPTWSWASVNAEITHLGSGYEACQPLAHLLEAATVPVGKDTTGEIKDAHLRFSGLLQSLDTTRVSNSFIAGSYTIEFQASETHLQSPLHPILTPLAGPDNKIQTCSSLPCDIWGRGVTMLPLLSFRNESDPAAKCPGYGLLLRQQAGSLRTYTKCGVFSLRSKALLEALFPFGGDIIQGGAVQEGVVKETLRSIATDVGVDLFNSKGGLKNTQQLGADVIRSLNAAAGLSSDIPR